MRTDILVLALTALRRNALRSALTALGIVIGVAAVVALLTIGRGTSLRVAHEIERLGTRLLVVKLGLDARGGNGAQIQAKAFDYADVEAIREQVRGGGAVAPVASLSARVVARRSNWLATVIGTENAFLEARDWRLRSGRSFSGHELQSGKSVCIIGATIQQKLFGAGDALGEILRVRTAPCLIVGVLAARGQSGLSDDADNLVLMPLYGFQRRLQGTPDLQSILVLARPEADPSLVRTRVEGLLRERRGLGPRETENFHVLEMRQVAEAMAGTARTLTALLAAIGAVSLLVGGIGIMNIMLVAVTGRTGEIGDRLAIGALPRQVLGQFLAEAVLLAVLGGLAGIAAGFAIAAAARLWLPIPLVVDPAIITLAFAASALVGIVFGYVPAARAAALDPVEALRRD